MHRRVCARHCAGSTTADATSALRFLCRAVSSSCRFDWLGRGLRREERHGCWQATGSERHARYLQTHFASRKGRKQREFIAIAQMTDAEHAPFHFSETGPKGHVEALVNFFADDARAKRVVAMSKGFCRLLDWLQRDPFENLRNFPLQEGEPVRGAGGLYSCQESVDSIDPPKFVEVPSFNYEAAAA